jgi:acetyl-CoA synthetase
VNRRHTKLRDELLAERRLPTEQYWASVEQRLDWPLARGLNLAHECCDRWAGDYVEALPRTEVGKIKRSAVRSMP